MKVNLQMAGCGRLKGPSGVTVTPSRMNADTLATRPLKDNNNGLCWSHLQGNRLTDTSFHTIDCYIVKSERTTFVLQCYFSL